MIDRGAATEIVKWMRGVLMRIEGKSVIFVKSVVSGIVF